jgi:hypothetical protein
MGHNLAASRNFARAGWVLGARGTDASSPDDQARSLTAGQTLDAGTIKLDAPN